MPFQKLLDHGSQWAWTKAGLYEGSEDHAFEAYERMTDGGVRIERGKESFMGENQYPAYAKPNIELHDVRRYLGLPLYDIHR